MVYNKQIWIDGSSPANAARLGYMEEGIAQAHAMAEDGVTATPAEWELPLSSFTGATDDAKLGDFMAYAAAQSYKGITCLLDEAKNYSFSTKRTLYSGFSLKGPDRPQDQARSSAPIGCEVTIGGTGGLFQMPASDVFGCSFQGLSLDGSASRRLIDGSSSAVLWTSVFRDISAQNLGGVLGSSAQRLLLTACTIDGWWNVNNVQDVAISIGGSDCRVMPSEFLLDAPPELLSADQYLMELSSLSKTHLQNFYITAEGHSAILITGTGDMIVIRDSSIEGRNAGAPSPGALIRMTGNTRLTLRDCWLAYCMTNPAATGRNDAGYVHATAGSVLMDGCIVERATGVAETVPILYASGGTHIVRNVRSVGFTGKPRVQQSVAGLIDADSSVTVVTG